MNYLNVFASKHWTGNTCLLNVKHYKATFNLMSALYSLAHKDNVILK